MAEAVKYNVLPLDDRAQERFNATLAGRPDYMGGRKSLALYPGMIAMKENAFIDVKNQSSSIVAELDSSGTSGVIVAQGGSHSGWSLFVKDGKPAFAYNYLGKVTTITSSEALPAGPVTITYDFVYDGGGYGKGGTGTISINGKKVVSGRLERTIPFIFGVETVDVGMDLYSNVSHDYPKGDNEFNGKIKKVVISTK